MQSGNRNLQPRNRKRFFGLDVVKTFEKASGVKIPYEMKPRRAGDVPVNYCDATKLKKNLDGKRREIYLICVKIHGDGRRAILMDMKHNNRDS